MNTYRTNGDTIKRNNVHISAVTEKRGERGRKLFEKIMAENLGEIWTFKIMKISRSKISI